LGGARCLPGRQRVFSARIKRNPDATAGDLAALVDDRGLLRVNRSAGPRRNRPPGQIGNSAARLSCGDVPAGKRSRLCPLNPHSKTTEFNNQLGHFINALKQSPSTTKATHTPSLEVRHIANTCTTRQDLPTPEEYCSTKGECSKPMCERRLASLTTERLNDLRARSICRLSARDVSSIQTGALPLGVQNQIIGTK
jgi:hypothetical protein